MRQYRLTVAPDVHHQIREQVLYIAQDSIDHALAWQDRLLQAFQGLAEFAGYAVDEAASERLGYTLHRLVFERDYLVHYVIDETPRVVRVVNFRHTGRLPRRGEP